jgi:hypothetical protein
MVKRMVNAKRKKNKIILITSVIIAFAAFTLGFFIEWESCRQVQKRWKIVDLSDLPAAQPEDKTVITEEEQKFLDSLENAPSWRHRAMKVGIISAFFGFLITFFSLHVAIRLPKSIDNAILKITNYLKKNTGLQRLIVALTLIATIPGFLWGISDCTYRRKINVCSTEEWLGLGLWGSFVFALATFFGSHILWRLVLWVYEGFKEEKSTPTKNLPPTRKKAK